MEFISPQTPVKHGRTWDCRKRDGLAASLCTPRIRILCLPVHSDAPPAPSRSVECSAAWTEASIGNACYLAETMWDAPGSPWTHTAHRLCLPECGKWKCTLGGNSAVVRGAEFTS